MAGDRVIPEDPFGPIKTPASTVNAPSAEEVNRFHTKADTDSSNLAVHHTLGVKHDQASPGDHKHDGTNSLQLLENKVLTGSKGGNVALGNLITLLAEAFGFQDSTT
jgi:hypothetical protein